MVSLLSLIWPVTLGYVNKTKTKLQNKSPYHQSKPQPLNTHTHTHIHTHAQSHTQTNKQKQTKMLIHVFHSPVNLITLYVYQFFINVFYTQTVYIFNDEDTKKKNPWSFSLLTTKSWPLNAKYIWNILWHSREAKWLSGRHPDSHRLVLGDGRDPRFDPISTWPQRAIVIMITIIIVFFIIIALPVTIIVIIITIVII